MDEVANSVGALGEASDAVAGTDGLKLQKALAELQVAAIQAGDVIGPFVLTVVSRIGTVADAFAALPGPAQWVALAQAGRPASVGPCASHGGPRHTHRNITSLALGRAVERD